MFMPWAMLSVESLVLCNISDDNCLRHGIHALIDAFDSGLSTV